MSLGSIWSRPRFRLRCSSPADSDSISNRSKQWSRSRREKTRVNASPDVAETFLLKTRRTIFGRRSHRWGSLTITEVGRGSKSCLGPQYLSKNQERFPVRTSEVALSMPSFGCSRLALFTENLQPPPTGGIIARVLPSLTSVENPSV